jgi:hypothetical protein
LTVPLRVPPRFNLSSRHDTMSDVSLLFSVRIEEWNRYPLAELPIQQCQTIPEWIAQTHGLCRCMVTAPMDDWILRKRGRVITVQVPLH